MMDANLTTTAFTRFGAPSDRIDRPRLRGETNRLVAIGLLISMGFLGVAFVYLVALPKDEAPPPAVARLIIRKPRATKPFQLKRQRLNRPGLAASRRGLARVGRVQSPAPARRAVPVG